MGTDISISEMRPDDVEAVAQLLGADAAGVAAMRSMLQDQRSLSLVARDAQREGQLVGAIVCHGPGRSNYQHQITIAESHRDSDLSQRLADLAMRKLSARGIRKCRLEANEVSFWPGLRWQNKSA